MPSNKTEKSVSGFVSILGRPNAGKSTLLNSLVGSKVAIVSSKPQTTQQAIQAVVTLGHAQVVFLDTPGIHQGDLLIHKRMMMAVHAALDQRDLLLWIADATQNIDEEEKRALQLLKDRDAPAFLLLNKVDRLRNKQQLLPLMEGFTQEIPFRECLPVSALTGEGLDELLGLIVAAMPEGPRYFPEDYLTDQPERHLAAELIREKILDATHQEVPHSVAVLIENWEEVGGLTRIHAQIVVEREGHKKIIIGSRGAMLKQIGTLARQEMESILGRKLFLQLFVKTRSKWRQSAEFLNELDWRYMAGGSQS